MLKRKGILSKHVHYGFSLVELLVTLTVLLVIIAIALPMLLRTFINFEANSTRHRIIQTINLAKATSYSEHKRVFMCLLDEHNVCNKNSDKHLVLFIDKNHNNNFDENIDRLIRKETLDLQYAKVFMRAAGRRHYVRFSADSGTPRGFMGHFSYCPTHPSNTHEYQISFNMVGNIRHKPKGKYPMDC